MPTDDERLKPLVVYPEDPEEGADREAFPHVLYFADLGEEDEPRTGDELASAFTEYTADSLKGFLDQFPVHIGATVIDPDGQPVHVACPVTDEDTFTAAGLTNAIPELYTWYVRSRIYDELTRRNRGMLTSGESDRLNRMIAMLETSLGGHE